MKYTVADSEDRMRRRARLGVDAHEQLLITRLIGWLGPETCEAGNQAGALEVLSIARPLSSRTKRAGR